MWSNDKDVTSPKLPAKHKIGVGATKSTKW